MKSHAFQPAAADNRVSVFCVSGASDAETWALGDRYVAPGRGKPVLARAELARDVVHAVGLRVVPDNVPPRHANIEGWPAAKDEWKMKAIELAAVSCLQVKP